MTVGEKIRQLRENKGIHQYELAKELGCIKQSISGWETGKFEPSLFYLYSFSRFLRCKP